MLLCLDCCESRDDERNGNEVRKEHPTAASVDTVLRLDMKLSNLRFAKLRNRAIQFSFISQTLLKGRDKDFQSGMEHLNEKECRCHPY